MFRFYLRSLVFFTVIYAVLGAAPPAPAAAHAANTTTRPPEKESKPTHPEPTHHPSVSVPLS